MLNKLDIDEVKYYIMKDLFSKFNLDLGKEGMSIGKFNIMDINFQKMFGEIISIILIIICMYFTIKIGSSIINKSVEKQRKLKYSIDERKYRTIAQVMKSILRYSVYFFGILGILNQLFGTITFAFASIGGVAIGFGAQNIIKDIFNGFFILFEDQFAVGDYVDIEGKSGLIESIELRVTRIRDFNGDLHIIPNGLISKVTNHSRGDMRVLVSIDIAYSEDIDKTINIIEKTCEKYKIEDKNMVEGPGVLGVTDIKNNSYTIKVIGKAKSMTQWDCENEIRKRIKYALDKADIKIAQTKVYIIEEV